MSNEILEIVNEKDEVIGTESREKIHQRGLLHREVHVWFITPNREIIFQHRAKTKDTYPDLLDSTVGGHVGLGMSYEETAIKECKEETGVNLSKGDIITLKKIKMRAEDQTTGKINYAFKTEFIYLYKGKIEGLKTEKNQAQGFEAWSIKKLFHLSDEEKKRFIPGVLSHEFLELYKKMDKYCTDL